MNRNYLIFLVVMTCMVCVRCGGDDRGDFIEGIVNFSHLEHLTELVTDDAGDFAIVHIYAEHPSYEWVDAEGEGVACVDDVARAIVVYLMHYEATRDSLYLASVRPLFNFLLMMQCEDGEFYNFLDQGYEINRNGITSRKSFNFWAVRAYWALACGCRIFSEIDNDYTNLLEKAFLRCKVPLSRRLENYHRYTMLHDRRYPVWLVNEYGSDASAVMILAICEYLGFRKDAELENFADQLADGICEMQVVHESIHSGAFLSWIDTWHAWGSAQTQALALWGKLTGNRTYIDRGRLEADHYYLRLLTYGHLNEWRLSDEVDEIVFPQISYGIRCMALGLLNLFEATGDSSYAICAGLTASWLMGNNAPEEVMYDQATGRCYDGIVDSTSINRNAGAESTIEALMTLEAIGAQPIAYAYLLTKAEKELRQIIDEQGTHICRIYEGKDFRVGVVHDIVEDKYRLLRDKKLYEFLENHHQ